MDNHEPARMRARPTRLVRPKPLVEQQHPEGDRHQRVHVGDDARPAWTDLADQREEQRKASAEQITPSTTAEPMAVGEGTALGADRRASGARARR